MMKLKVFFKYSSRTILLVLGITVFLFGLFSGADTEQGLLTGLIKNSPNALPGLGLLLLTAIAWKYELIGGILTTAFGLFLVYFFNFSGGNFFLTTFILTLLITIVGLFFTVSWILSREN